MLGGTQELFFFHPSSPGCAFLLPHGVRVYNRLVALLRRAYFDRGFAEVATPLLYKSGLWETSGHLTAYGENMFSVAPGMGGSCCAPAVVASPVAGVPAVPEEPLGLKPMNCPGHCLIFASRGRSYRDLPLRYADFSPLHRNEASGGLGGLTRLIRFAQDDAHFFCTHDQVGGEVAGCLAFLGDVYGLFGFGFRYKLATRPPVSVGGEGEWAAAEAALTSALVAHVGAGAFETDPGGGAFYGPKIDVFVRDALGREHQCGTIQLDFQLPGRFGLVYDGADGGKHTPVIIHRAILGSLERMMALLIEQCGGRWPFWLSPRQVVVTGVAPAHDEYAREVAAVLRGGSSAHLSPATTPELYVDVDDSGRSLARRVRDGRTAQYNLICVVGDAEVAAGTVDVRFRDALSASAFVASAQRVGVPGCQAASPEVGVSTLSPTQLRQVCLEMQGSYA